jgi:hypothetical protein
VPRHVLPFSLLGRSVGVGCADPQVRALLLASYGAFRVRPGRTLRPPDLDLEIEADLGGKYRLVRAGQPTLRPAADLGDLMYLVDGELVVGLQKLRTDLYFLHAAALELGGRISLLVAESGGGKSTLAWALAHHGFRFASDELAPIEPAGLKVHPYPRALALKDDPPDSYPLPRTAMRTSRSAHIALPDLPGGRVRRPLPLGAIFFLRRRGRPPSARALGAAEAAARLYVSALNPLAHAAHGLDAAVRIAGAARRFELEAGDLAATARLVRQTLLGAPPS